MLFSKRNFAPLLKLLLLQATQLLQARKSEEDVSGICDMCDKLRVSQIIKILNVYTPADEFEERVSPAFVRKIRTKLQVFYFTTFKVLLISREKGM